MVNLTKLRKASELNAKLLQVISPEQIEDLAKGGLCPHYRLYNPASKDESFWFIASEMLEWFENNYIKAVKGHLNLEIKFLQFSPTTEKTAVPTELSQIRELYELPFSALYNASGIYFLCLNGKIQYIGQSVNVSNRVAQHISENKKEFNQIFFTPCPENQLNDLEGFLVRKFNPPLTKSSPVIRNFAVANAFLNNC